MASIDELLGGGTYVPKQLHCKDRIIAWSHNSRFELGRRLTSPHRGKRLLDYGCGDGTFLAKVHDLFPDAIGIDASPEQVASCRERFTPVTGHRFLLPSELSAPEHAGAYGVVTCMEVFEHLVDEVRDAVLAELERLLAPSGLLVVSVPIESGPSLLIKEAVRTVAGWRKLGDYQFKERYTPRELLTMVFAGEDTPFERPLYGQTDPSGPYYFHKGFNWRAFRARLARDFRIERTLFSPLDFPGGLVSSQAWFLCTSK